MTPENSLFGLLAALATRRSGQPATGRKPGHSLLVAGAVVLFCVAGARLYGVLMQDAGYESRAAALGEQLEAPDERGARPAGLLGWWRLDRRGQSSGAADDFEHDTTHAGDVIVQLYQPRYVKGSDS